MKPEKLSQKKEQGAQTKLKLYACAEELFKKSNNFSDISVEEITNASGVTKGTFYVHFDSKDTLFISLLIRYVQQLDTDYLTFLNALPTDMPKSDVLLALIGKIADEIIDLIGYENMRSVYKLQLTASTATESIKGYQRPIYKMFSDVLEQGILNGEFRPALPLDQMTKHFVMAIRGLCYEWCIRYPDFDLKQQALDHFQLLLTAISSK